MSKSKGPEAVGVADVVVVEAARKLGVEAKSQSVANSTRQAFFHLAPQGALGTERASQILCEALRSRLLGPSLEKDTRLGGRFPHQLVEAAKARSGLTSNTELLEYALAKVALEDDFGEFLASRWGTVDPDLDLEF